MKPCVSEDQMVAWHTEVKSFNDIATAAAVTDRRNTGSGESAEP